MRRVYVIKSDEWRPHYKKVGIFRVLYRGFTKDNVDLVPEDIVVVPSTIPTEINRALEKVLAPFGRAKNIDSLRQYRWGAGGEGGL